MDLSIEREGSYYNVKFSEATKTVAEKLQNVYTQHEFGISQANIPAANASVLTSNPLTGIKITSLVELAHAHFSIHNNKINTIKAIRTVADCGLKEAKEIVDYAAGSLPADWIKNLLNQ